MSLLTQYTKTHPEAGDSNKRAVAPIFCQGGRMSFSHLSSLSLPKIRKLLKLVKEKDATLKRANKLHARIKKILNGDSVVRRKRKYQRRIKIVSQEIKSSNGRFDVKFENPVVTKLTGMCFQVLRFFPKKLKAQLQRNGKWDDVAQTMYTTAIEFFRAKNGNLTTELSNSDYKKLMRLANHNIRETLSELVSGFGGRKTMEKYVNPKRLNKIPMSNEGASPAYIHEKTLYSAGDTKAAEVL